MQTMDKPDITTEERIPGKGMGFGYFLTTIQGGDLHAELTKALHEAAASLNQHFQDFRGVPKAEIGVKITLKLEKGVVVVTADKTVKLPKPPSAGAILYIDNGNNLCQEDPRQLSMFPRSGPRPVD